MANYLDLTRTYLQGKNHTGVARTLLGLCSKAQASGFRPILFHPQHRAWYTFENPATLLGTLQTKEKGLFRRATVYAATKIDGKIFQILPPSRKHGWVRARQSLILRLQLWKFSFVTRLEILEREAVKIEFKAGDSIHLVDLNLTSIPFYQQSLEQLKTRLPGLELIGFLHDLFPIECPNQCDFLFRQQFLQWIDFLKNHCEKISTNSEAVAHTAKAYFPSQTIRMVRFGGQLERIQTTTKLTAPDVLRALYYGRKLVPDSTKAIAETRSWILSVGVQDARKNHILLLESMEPLWKSGKLRLPLLIAGRASSETKRLIAKIRSSTVLKQNVCLLGEVSDENLWLLYQGARLVIVPSIYEGFGLPVSEALQFGCPCFVSRVGGTAEVAAECVEYFDPLRSEQLTALVERFFSDSVFEEQLRIRALGFKPHSWQNTLEDLASTQPPAYNKIDLSLPPIDAVYTWCDGSDSGFLSASAFGQEGAEAHRFRNRDELKFSLRSLEKYAPWVRNVFIVTNGQIPRWLDRNHPRLRLVSHREIFDSATHIPNFNSLAIETHLSRIPGISEHFLYFNDDFLLGAPLPKEAFFSSEGRTVYFVERYALPAPKKRSLLGRDDLMKQCHRYNHRLLEEKYIFPADARDPTHTPQLYRRSVLSKLVEKWGPEVHLTRQSQFRRAHNVKIGVLYPYFAALHLQSECACLLRTVWNGSSEYFFKTLRDRDLDKLSKWLEDIERIQPTFFCLNDEIKDPTASRQADERIQPFLQKYFPAISSFERSA